MIIIQVANEVFIFFSPEEIFGDTNTFLIPASHKK